MDPETVEKYIKLIRQKVLLTYSITFEQFDSKARKLLKTVEQVRLHNEFVNQYRTVEIGSIYTDSLAAVQSYNNMEELFKKNKPAIDWLATQTDGSLAATSKNTPPTELCIPDIGFMKCKIAILAWENHVKCEEDVADVVVQACQTFLKNILTAMITKKKGYKIRDGQFQYGFNHPVPDPLIRNYNNIIEETQEKEDEKTINEQQILYSYSCGKRIKTDNLLTVQLLYDTIRENPRMLGVHSLHSKKLYNLSSRVR